MSRSKILLYDEFNKTKTIESLYQASLIIFELLNSVIGKKLCFNMDLEEINKIYLNNKSILNVTSNNNKYCLTILSIIQSTQINPSLMTLQTFKLLTLLMKNSLYLIEFGYPISYIIGRFDKIKKLIIKILNRSSFIIPGYKKFFDHFYLMTLNILNKTNFKREKQYMGKLIIDSLFSVYDNKKNVLSIESINVKPKLNNILQHSTLVKGIILQKSFADHLFPRSLQDIKILSVIGNIKTTNSLFNKNVFEKVNSSIDIFYLQRPALSNNKKLIINKLIAYKIKIIFFQYTCNQNFLMSLNANHIHSINWLGLIDSELITLIAKSRMIYNFKYFTYNHIGYLHNVAEIKDPITQKQFLLVENFKSYPIVTLHIGCPNLKIFKVLKIQLLNTLKILRSVLIDKSLIISGGVFELIVFFKLVHLNNTIFNSNDIIIYLFLSIEIEYLNYKSYFGHTNKPKNINDFYSIFVNKLIKKNEKYQIDNSIKGLIEPTFIIKAEYYTAFKFWSYLINMIEIYNTF